MSRASKSITRTFGELMTMGPTEEICITRGGLTERLIQAGCAIKPFLFSEAVTKNVFVDGGETEWEEDPMGPTPATPNNETELVVIEPAVYAAALPVHVVAAGGPGPVLWMLENLDAREIDAMYRLDALGFSATISEQYDPF